MDGTEHQEQENWHFQFVDGTRPGTGPPVWRSRARPASNVMFSLFASFLELSAEDQDRQDSTVSATFVGHDIADNDRDERVKKASCTNSSTLLPLSRLCSTLSS